MKLYRMYKNGRYRPNGDGDTKVYLARKPYGEWHTHEGPPGGPKPVGPYDDPGPEIWWTANSAEAREVSSTLVDGIYIEGTLEP